MPVPVRLLFLCVLALLPAISLSTVIPEFPEARGLDVRDMVALARVSSPTLSPDGSMVRRAHVMCFVNNQ